MTPLQTLAFSVLWLAVLTLAGLVLLLYRQVDKAYRESRDVQSAALLPGIEAPAIEVLDGPEIVPLRMPVEDSYYLMAFVSSSCGGCQQLMSELSKDPPKVGKVVVLLTEGPGFPDLRDKLPSSIEIHSLAHPPDVRQDYGVTVVPLVYALKGNTVLAAKSVSTIDGIHELMSEAVKNDERLMSEMGRLAGGNGQSLNHRNSHAP